MEKSKTKQKQWKRYLFCFFAMVLLAGCGSSNKEKEYMTEDKKFCIGMVQLVDNPSFQDMRQGFMEQLEELGYGEETVEILFQDAGGNQSVLHQILQSFQEKKVDLIVPLVTSATQAAVNLGGDIPIVFISVTDPVGAGILTNMEKPDRGATGTCNEVPVDQLFELAAKLNIGITSVGILYDPALPNSVITVQKAKEYLEKTGIKTVEAAVTNSSEVQAATQSLCEKSDIIYVPIDSTILSAMPQVVEVATSAGKAVYGSAPSMVESGALASISVSEYETGRQSGILAAKILEGAKVEEVPAVIVNDFLMVINKKTAEKLNILLHEEIEKEAIFVE